MAEKSSVAQDRQRSELLKKQLHQMSDDFDFMKKSREEWKKQLQARFQDIERKIDNSKQFIMNEAKRTNDTLLAFQHKFEFQLTKAKEQLNQNINNLGKSTDDRFAKKSEEIDNLNKGLDDEKKDRMQQHEEGMKQARERMDKLNEGLEKQKETRVKNEKENMGKINESLFIIKEQLKEERDERNLKLRELQKNTEAELSSQRKFNEEFHDKTFNDFKHSLGELRQEMDARFSSKDEIINSISKVVRTLQDTLRYPN